MVRVAWVHCFSGVAGDMLLGALLDAGAELSEVRAILERLPMSGWGLEAQPVLRGGLAATRAVVSARDETVVRTHAHIVGLVEEARLPPRVRDRSLRTFALLARAEGRAHRRPPAQVHFHEVGGHDAVVDVVGCAAALEVLDVGAVTASPVTTGTGVVRTAHGVLPNPSPAVLELLRGAPLVGRPLNVELATPTGAALLAALAGNFGPMPAMRIESTGYGAGARELDEQPNVVQVVLGVEESEASGPPAQPMVLLETNLDDVTGEVLGHAVEELMAAGAADAWLSALLMKKGRPGHLLSVLCDPALAPGLAQLLVSETGTLGVRWQELSRTTAPRSTATVDLDGTPLRVKVSPGRVKPEAADAARRARLSGRPLREVLGQAEAAWRAGREGGGGDEPGGDQAG